jgi:hypothetical protein
MHKEGAMEEPVIVFVANGELDHDVGSLIELSRRLVWSDDRFRLCDAKRHKGYMRRHNHDKYRRARRRHEEPAE